MEPRDRVDLPPGTQVGREFALDGLRWQVVATTPGKDFELRAPEAFFCTIAPIEVPTERAVTFVPSDRLREISERAKHLPSARTTREKIDVAVEIGSPLKLDVDEKGLVLAR